MHKETIVLFTSAVTLGLLHTILGPDHYLPFVAMAKARNWTARKTAMITFICGCGHITSSILLGLVAIPFGMSLTSLNFIEKFRGEIATYLLICFGFAYFVWGIYLAIKNKNHCHLHSHLHCDKEFKNKKELTPWVLFIIFILGPCEPLIPLIMYPALNGEFYEVIMVTILFGLTTLAVMLSTVLTLVFGINNLKLDFFEKYGNALAGAVICSSGLTIKFLGL